MTGDPCGAAAFHETAIPVPSRLATTPVGCAGGPIGASAVVAGDDGPSPASLVATTVNVYLMKGFRFVMNTACVEPSTVPCAPPGISVTV